MFDMILKFLLNRLKEPSTWKAIIGTLTAFTSFHVSPDQQVAIIGLGVALMGGVDYLPESVLNKQTLKEVDRRISDSNKKPPQTLLAVARQQQILSYLGYHPGPIDGVWGRASKRAMAQFELSPEFSPATPNNGDMLDVSKPLPRVLQYDSKFGTLHLLNVDDTQLPAYDQTLINRIHQSDQVAEEDTSKPESGFSGFNDK